MAKQYPSASVSRTLDPSMRSFTTVVGQHDKRLTDADINLIQDIQDLKAKRVIDNQIFSGALSQTPFVFSPTKENIFKIPAYDVMFNGEVVTIGGFMSEDMSLNSVSLPLPTPLGAIPTEEASIFVVYLELWYRGLDPTTGSGYAVSDTQRYIYPNGCIKADSNNFISDDVIDPFQGLNTTSRVQTQWTIQVAPISLFYDFERFRYGLDPGDNDTNQTIYAKAHLDSAEAVTSDFAFRNMGEINGDYGLWRGGDGSAVPALPTIDGYSYAMPIAVVFQRNTGLFDPTENPFGCGAKVADASGKLATISGRYDRKFADAIYESDVVDTRMTVSLPGYDWTKLIGNGFSDLVNGSTRLKIARGEEPGSKPTALASTPSYTVTVGPKEIGNTDWLGPFDGLMNGFSTDERTFFTVLTRSISDKVVGTPGTRWTNGDVVEIDISDANTTPVIASAVVQGLTLVPDGTGSLSPVLLLSGQVVVTGLGSNRVQIRIDQKLQGTEYDPGIQDLYITIGVRYKATTRSSGYSTGKIPSSIEGGVLYDNEARKTFSIFGVSDFTHSKRYISNTSEVVAFNPQYSNKVFGTRVEVAINAENGELASNGLSTEFVLNLTDLNQQNDGIYVVKAFNKATKAPYTITSQWLSLDGTTCTLSLAGAIPTRSIVIFTVLLKETAQMGFNAPIKAVTAIEETVFIGNSNLFTQMEGRVSIVSRSQSGNVYTLILAAKNGRLSGISGDDTNKLLFLKLPAAGLLPDRYEPIRITSVKFFNAFVSVVVETSVPLLSTPFFMLGAFSPALDPLSTLAFSFDYVPYQGEGKTNRDYAFVHTEDMAYITTNGTGSAPIVGLKDVYPYNRELPLATLLPSQILWDDSELGNQAVATYFGSNYDAKKFSNIEHTFATPLKTNDFIEPVGGWKRKKLRLSTPSGRGFAKAFPHMGFAIQPPIARVTQSNPVTATFAPVMLYVNNITGLDSYDGLSPLTPKRTISGALITLPKVLRHPCYVFIAATSEYYTLASLKSTLEVAKLGDGEVTQINRYCLDNLAFSIQDEGRLYIGREANATDRITIDATGFIPFGDGPTSAFVISNSRVVLNGIEFKGFRDAALFAQSSYVELVDCLFNGNQIAGSFSNGSNVTASRCTLIQKAASTGFIVSNSDLVTSNTRLEAPEARVNAFYIAERSASVTLLKHNPTEEVNLTRDEWVVDKFEPKYETIAQAKLSSSIICGPDFTTSGGARITSNSVLVQPSTGVVFGGTVYVDSSSVISTDIS